MQDSSSLKSMPLQELLAKLAATADGLSQAEAEQRLAKYGPNEIAEKKEDPFLKLLAYFWGPIPWMIEAALILSGVVQHWSDFFIILALLLANAGVRFFEERQAGNAIAALKEKLAITALARRDGAWRTLAARDLVPGDVVRLRLGDIVPADARLLEGTVDVDQSALTGESLPTSCKAGDALFSGSIIRRGEDQALIYGTGKDTYFGKTTQLVEGAHTVSHFQRAVIRIGNFLIVFAIVLVAIIFVASLLRGDAVLTTLEFALVLLIAAIPVAMPTVLSVTMSVGARLLAKKEAVVSKLTSIEELAGMDVLCSDKTGTLTQNVLTLGAPFAVRNVAADHVIFCGALATRAEDNDPIDHAIRNAALGEGRDRTAFDAYHVTHFQPFDPVHKRTEATATGPDGKIFRTTMGAVESIMALAADAAELQAAVDAAVGEFAARGFRALGVAEADGDGGAGAWRFLGVIPLFDPPRADAKETIATAERMGVSIKMVTGDQLAIARETARQLNLGADILDAAVLETKNSAGDADTASAAVAPAVAEKIEHADGFAQVFPEHKFQIVAALQARGHIVGMTGDGVNDAPALKKADCGIAVSGATDAARAAASIVLLAPGLGVVIDAIKESRRIFQRMTSYAIYRIAETLRVLLFMTLAILVFNFYPVTAVMIVILALLNDGAVLAIAFDRADYKDTPDKWNMHTVLGVSTMLAAIGVVATFGLFYLAERVFRLDQASIQTLMYLKLSVAGQLTIFLTRTRGPFWSDRPARALLAATIVAQGIATLIAVYGIFVAPVGWGWAAFVWCYAAAWFLLNDRLKLLAYRIFDPTAGLTRATPTPVSTAHA